MNPVVLACLKHFQDLLYFPFFAWSVTLILLIVIWTVLCLIILAMCVYSERVV